MFTKNYNRFKYSALNYGNKVAGEHFAELVTNSASILKGIVDIFDQTGYLYEVPV